MGRVDNFTIYDAGQFGGFIPIAILTVFLGGWIVFSKLIFLMHRYSSEGKIRPREAASHYAFGAVSYLVILGWACAVFHPVAIAVRACALIVAAWILEWVIGFGVIAALTAIFGVVALVCWIVKAMARFLWRVSRDQ